MKRQNYVRFIFLLVIVFAGCADLSWIHKPSRDYPNTAPEEIVVFESSRLPSQPYEVIGEIRFSKFLGSYENSLKTIKESAADAGAQGIIVLESDKPVTWGAKEGLFHFGSSYIKAAFIRFKKETGE